MSELVVVTGITGYIAQHCALQLLEAGYRVRGTARSADKQQSVITALKRHLSPQAQAELAQLEVRPADLSHDAGWGEAMEGAQYLLHVASPFPNAVPKDENELITPARQGVMRALSAAARAGVKHTVLTSSVASIAYGVPHNGRIFSETDWSNVNGPNIGPYEKSKTLAERLAWDFISANPSGMTLTAVNPGLVLGPLISSQTSTSHGAVKALMNRELLAIPNFHFTFVDVRDVAAAHVAAMTSPQAKGQRYLCAVGDYSLADVAQVLREHYTSRGYRIPKLQVPSWVARLAARFDDNAKLSINNLDDLTLIDNSKVLGLLGRPLITFEDMVRASADSMIGYGVIATK
jgi:nucleoside-diphosphate-sugar epimerase